jgi:hypothetical protein
MHALVETVATLTVGEAQSLYNLSMFPLFGQGVEERGYLTLDSALATGSLTITELQRPSVPTLRVTNELIEAVLLLDGEELVGAQQDRVANLTILIPAGSTLEIPVSCVEAGRWDMESPLFRSSPRAHYARGRALRHESVSYAMSDSRGASRRSEQQAVWYDIASKFLALDVDAPTMAERDAFERYEPTIREYVDGLRPQDGQTGACFAIDGSVRGLDLFDSATTLRELLPKLVRSYALDAIETVRGDAKPPERAAAVAFVRSIEEAEVQKYEAIGEGEDLRFESPLLTGGALYARERIIHLCAFARAARDSGADMLRSSRRAELRRPR